MVACTTLWKSRPKRNRLAFRKISLLYRNFPNEWRCPDIKCVPLLARSHASIRTSSIRIIDRATGGPDAERRARFRTTIRGEAWDGAGRKIAMEIRTPEAYAFTALSAVEAVTRVLRGDVPPGCWTPAEVFGCELMQALPGVEIVR